MYWKGSNSSLRYIERKQNVKNKAIYQFVLKKIQKDA